MMTNKNNSVKDAKQRSTPLEPGVKLSKEGAAAARDGEGKNPYAELVGSLLYLTAKVPT